MEKIKRHKINRLFLVPVYKNLCSEIFKYQYTFIENYANCVTGSIQNNLGNFKDDNQTSIYNSSEESYSTNGTTSEAPVNSHGTREQLLQGYSDIQSITNKIKNCTNTLINNLKKIPHKKFSIETENYPYLRLRRQDSSSLVSDVIYRMNEAHCTPVTSNIEVDLQNQILNILQTPDESKKVPLNIAEKFRIKYNEFRRRSASQKDRIKNTVKGKLEKSRRARSSSPTCKFEQNVVFIPSAVPSTEGTSSIYCVTHNNSCNITEEPIKRKTHKSLKDIYINKLKNRIFNEHGKTKTEKDTSQGFLTNVSNSTCENNIELEESNIKVDVKTKVTCFQSKQTLIDEAIELATDMTLKYLLKGSQEQNNCSSYQNNDDSAYYDINYVTTENSCYYKKPFDVKKKPLDEYIYSCPTEHVNLLANKDKLPNKTNNNLLTNLIQNSKELLRINTDNDMCRTLAMLIKNLYAVRHRLVQSKRQGQVLEYPGLQQNAMYNTGEQLLYTIDYNDFLQLAREEDKEIKEVFDNKSYRRRSLRKRSPVKYYDTKGIQTGKGEFRTVGSNTSKYETSIAIDPETTRTARKHRSEKSHHRTKSSKRRDKEKHVDQTTTGTEPEEKTNEVKSSKAQSQINQPLTEILFKKKLEEKKEKPQHSSRPISATYQPNLILDDENRNWQTIGEMVMNRPPPAQQKKRDIFASQNHSKQGSLLNMREILIRNMDDPRTLKLNGRRLRQIRCPVVLTKLA